jgi:hypothetical protein
MIEYEVATAVFVPPPGSNDAWCMINSNCKRVGGTAVARNEYLIEIADPTPHPIKI